MTLFLCFFPSPSFWYGLSDEIILDENIFLTGIIRRLQLIFIQVEEYEQIKQLSAHFVLMGGCSFFACREVLRKNKKLDMSQSIIVIFAFLFVFFFSTLIESIQSILPASFERGFDWIDIIFSLFGGLIGILFFLFRNRDKELI